MGGEGWEGPAILIPQSSPKQKEQHQFACSYLTSFYSDSYKVVQPMQEKNPVSMPEIAHGSISLLVGSAQIKLMFSGSFCPLKMGWELRSSRVHE